MACLIADCLHCKIFEDLGMSRVARFESQVLGKHTYNLAYAYAE